MDSCAFLSCDRTNGGDDVWVGAATTEIAAHSLTDFPVGQFYMTIVRIFEGYYTQIAALVLGEHCNGRAYLSRRAISALESIMFKKRGLHWVKRFILREALNRDDLGTAGGGREHETTRDPMSVQDHRTSAAL